MLHWPKVKTVTAEAFGVDIVIHRSCDHTRSELMSSSSISQVVINSVPNIKLLLPEISCN